MNRFVTKLRYLFFSTLSSLTILSQFTLCSSNDGLIRESTKTDPNQMTQDFDCQTCYYVAKNNPSGCSDRWPGTETEPWCTIKKATNTLRAGDTVFIKEGIYYERVVPKYAGESGRYITYRNFNIDEVVIDGSRMLRKDGIKVEKKNYIQFVGLKIRGWDSAGINVEGPSSHIIFDKLTVEKNDYGIRFTGKPGEAVTDSEILNSHIQNNLGNGVFIYRTCENILIDHNVITKNIAESLDDHAHGIQMVVWSDDEYPRDGPRHVTISNNEISYNSTQGIMTWEVDYVLIQNNHIHHNGASGVQIENGTNYAVIENNLIENNSQSHSFEGGIWIDDAESIIVQGNTLRGNKMGLIIGRSGLTIARFNLIYHNNEGVKNNRNAIGLNVNYSTQDSIIVHNTLFKNGNQDTQRAGLSIASYTDKDENHTNKVENPSIKNNIISETVADLDLWVGNEAEGYESDFNVFYNTGELGIHFNNRNITWSQYLMVSSQDTNSITTNPFFSDPDHGDFSLGTESHAVDGGGPLTVTISNGEGISIPVVDARYFSDGFGLVEGDLIQVGSNPAVTVILVDYSQNSITVDTPISWSKGEGVSYPYTGSAPDIGALE